MSKMSYATCVRVCKRPHVRAGPAFTIHRQRVDDVASVDWLHKVEPTQRINRSLPAWRWQVLKGREHERWGRVTWLCLGIRLSLLTLTALVYLDLSLRATFHALTFLRRKLRRPVGFLSLFTPSSRDGEIFFMGGGATSTKLCGAFITAVQYIVGD